MRPSVMAYLLLCAAACVSARRLVNTTRRGLAQNSKALAAQFHSEHTSDVKVGTQSVVNADRKGLAQNIRALAAQSYSERTSDVKVGTQSAVSSVEAVVHTAATLEAHGLHNGASANDIVVSNSHKTRVWSLAGMIVLVVMVILLISFCVFMIYKFSATPRTHDKTNGTRKRTSRKEDAMSTGSYVDGATVAMSSKDIFGGCSVTKDTPVFSKSSRQSVDSAPWESADDLSTAPADSTLDTDSDTDSDTYPESDASSGDRPPMIASPAPARFSLSYTYQPVLTDSESDGSDDSESDGSDSPRVEKSRAVTV